jgi:hypothetical protein
MNLTSLENFNKIKRLSFLQLCEEQKEKYNINILNQTSEVQV